MKALVLNLPHSPKIYRCYRCSINSPAFCLPPLELLYAAGTLRQAGMETHFVDAVAERFSLEKTLDLVRGIQPDLVVSIMGYEHFTSDVDAVNYLRQHASIPHYAVMGYLPTHFSEETFRHLNADLILREEPEPTLRDVVEALNQKRGFDGIAGLAWRDGDAVRIGPNRPRMKAAELEALPYPARDLARIPLYREPFLSKPFTTFQAGRGCPFGCIYCTTSYGEQYALRSPAHVVAEIEDTRRRFGIRHFRFIDDTFAVNIHWTREFADRMEATGQKYDWVCLTRIDLMDEERMRLLRRAGCRRLYVGIESGSQKILDYYHKRYKAKDVPARVATARREGLEVVGYFVVGSPIETEADYGETVEMAQRLKLDMVSAYPMMPYPATSSFDNAGEPVEFTLYPYQVRYRNEKIMETARRRARDMMRSIYLSPHFMAGKLKWSVAFPAYTVHATFEFGRWLLGRNKQKRQTLL